LVALIWYFKENKFHLILGNLGFIKHEFCVVLLIMPLESFLKIISRASKFKMGAFGNHVGDVMVVGQLILYMLLLKVSEAA
jgi:hypothetical protein